MVTAGSDELGQRHGQRLLEVMPGDNWYRLVLGGVVRVLCSECQLALTVHPGVLRVLAGHR
jgi:hypothetical protein